MSVDSTLEKSLSYPVLVILIIGAIIGTGIFFAPVLGAQMSGSSSIIAWFVMGILSLYIASCFAELTSMYPTSGGVYEFAKQAFGRTTSFFVGWMCLLTNYSTIALVTLTAVSYLFATAGFSWLAFGVAVFFIILFNIITYRGVQASVTMAFAFALITIGTVILVSVGSIFVEQVPITFQTPLDPLALFVTIFLIAATYFGWEQATYLAGETKNGQTVVPKALMHATIAVFVLCMLYVLAAFLTLGEGVASATRLLVSMGQMQFGTSAPFAILTYLALIGTVATWIISSPRLLLSMAQDGLLLKQLARISPKYRTPSVAIVVQTGIILLFMVAGLESTESLLKLLMPLALFMYCSVMFAMVKLRITKPDHPRPFKAPFGIVGPIAMVLFFAALCIFWVVSDPESIGYVALGVSFFAVGIPLFFLVELYNNAQFSSRIKDISAWYTRLFERYILPLDVRKEILLYLGSLKGKTVVEYGCSTGTLTKSLQESVGGVGCIYCVNNSKVELMFAQSRLVHDIETHRAPVEFIYSPTYTTHVPPRIMSADAIVSIDTLSALSDPLPLLKQLSRLLPEHGHVCFFDFGDFFKLIPDQSWLASDESIKTMFLEAGMSVRVKRKYTSLWSYVFIYGIKSKEPVVII